MQNLIETIKEVQKMLPLVPESKKISTVNNLILLANKLTEQISQFGHIPENFKSNLYPGMTAQTQACEKRTEKAADAIMAAAEGIMGVTGKLDKTAQTTIMEHVNKIFEACSFQDLVAQHLNEIRLRLNELDADMADLSSMFHKDAAVVDNRKQREKHPDAHLLNGPPTSV